MSGGGGGQVEECPVECTTSGGGSYGGVCDEATIAEACAVHCDSEGSTYCGYWTSCNVIVPGVINVGCCCD